MEGFLTFDLDNLSPQGANLVVVTAVAVGTLYCFLGYRALKLLVGLTGFLLAGATAAILAAWISHGHHIFTSVAAILGGAVGAIAFFFLYKVGIFSIGLVALALCAHNLLGDQEDWAPWAASAAGIVGGLLALAIERPIMILATSIIGAWVLVSGIGHFLVGTQLFVLKDGTIDDPKLHTAMLATWATLSFAGACAQFATRKRQRR